MSITRTKRRESSVGRLINSIRPIPKKLWLHKAVSGIRIVVGMVTFATMVFAAYYGYTAWMHKQQTVAGADILRVEAETREYNDLSKRWTDDKVAEVSRQPATDFGYPRKEVTVQVTVDGHTHQFASFEGVVGREPELKDSSLAWGRPVSRESNPEVLLSREFFERLGGHVGEAGPDPVTVSVTVTRIVDDKSETQKIAMQIAGLLRKSTDKIFGPLDLAINLDRWQTHKSNSPMGESAQSRDSLVTYDRVDAYVPVHLAENVPEEEQAFDVQAEPSGEVEIIQSTGEIWASLADASDQSVPDESAVSRALGAVPHDLWPVWSINRSDGDRNHVYVAIRDDDPRWQFAPDGAPNLGELVSIGKHYEIPSEVTKPGVKLLRSEQPTVGVPKADALATFRTLQWLSFNERETPAVTQYSRIVTQDINTAIALDERYAGPVHSDTPLSWGIYEVDVVEPAVGQRSGLPKSGQSVNPAGALRVPVTTGHPFGGTQTTPAETGLLQGTNQSVLSSNNVLARQNTASQVWSLSTIVDRLKREVPECDFGSVSRGVVEVDLPRTSRNRFGGYEQDPRRSSLIRVRLVPTSFFARVVGQPMWRLVNSESLPCVLLGSREDIASVGSATISNRSLKVWRQFSSSQREIWLPAIHARSVSAEMTTVGFVVSGPWEKNLALNAAVDAAPNGIGIRKLFFRMPRHFSMLAHVPVEQTLELLRKDGFNTQKLDLSQLVSLSVPVRKFGASIAERIVSIPNNAKDHGEHAVLVADKSCTGGDVVIRIGDRTFENLRLEHDERVPNGFACVSPRLFRQLAFESAVVRNEIAGPERSALTIRFRDVHSLQQARLRLKDAGLELQPLVGLKQMRFAKYAVRAGNPDGDNSGVSSLKVGELVMALPTFHTVVPRLSVAAHIGNTDNRVESTSGPDDPFWFETRLFAGRPGTRDENSSGICLAKAVAERAFPGLSFDEMIGRMVRLRIQRNDAGRSPDIPMMLKVTAVADTPNCVVPLQTVTDWRLWQDGRLVYDTATGAFRTPAEVYEQRGFISAVFYAASEDSVQQLVDHLESMGCDVKHHLDERDRLLQLAIAVTMLVVLFVSGSVLNAIANSSAVSWMDLATRLKEIGVKMAYGVTRTDITLAYLTEGVLVGVIACLCGTALVIGTEPFLRDLIERTIGLGPEFFLVPIYASAMAWVYGVAAAVVIAFNMLGTVIPTWLALRRSPIELMKN